MEADVKKRIAEIAERVRLVEEGQLSAGVMIDAYYCDVPYLLELVREGLDRDNHACELLEANEIYIARLEKQIITLRTRSEN